MHSRPSRLAREGGLIPLLIFSASFAAATAPAGAALAQKAPPLVGAPPTRDTDMEIDPDAPPPPLPSVGKFAPGKQKSAAVDDDDKGPRRLGPPGAASIDMLLGVGAMRDVTNDVNLTKITVLSLVFGLQYRLGESLSRPTPASPSSSFDWRLSATA